MPRGLAWEIKQDNPVAWCRFEEASGTVKDIMTNGYDLTTPGSGTGPPIYRATGSPNTNRSYAMDFPGNTDSQIEGNGPDSAGVGFMTWEVMAYHRSGSSGNNRLFQQPAGTDNLLVINDQTNISFGLPGWAAISTTKPTDDAWHHYVFLYEKSSRGICIYIDGVLQAQDTSHGASNMTGQGVGNLVIGGKQGGGVAGDHWNGYVDEWAVYYTALSEARIADHAAAGFVQTQGPISAGMRF